MKAKAIFASVAILTILSPSLAVTMNSKQKSVIDKKIAEVTNAKCIMKYDYTYVAAKDTYLDSYTNKKVPWKQYIKDNIKANKDQFEAIPLAQVDSDSTDKDAWYLVNNPQGTLFFYMTYDNRKAEIYTCTAKL